MNADIAGAGSPPEKLRARAALSRLLEPLDGPGSALLRVLGPERMLRVIQGSEKVSAAQQEAAAEHLRVETSLRWRGIQEPLVRWRTRLPGLDPQRELMTIQRSGGGLLTPESPGWPNSLDDLGLSAPVALWYLGRLPQALPAADDCLALVGSRDCTGYGRIMSHDLATGLTGAGFTVVSGGAYGIDTAAHRAALMVRRPGKSSAAPTIAVMAGGLDRWYPAGNEELLREIQHRGALVSEVPLGTAPTRYRFLQRNRLIAALSASVIVVEARWRSGALNTAHHALSLGRQVGAVPGRADQVYSAGCHRLLREGAVCITDAAEAAELSGGITSASDLSENVSGRQSALQSATVQSRSKRTERRPHDDLDTEDLLIFDALPVRRGFPVTKISELSGLSAEQVRAGLGRLELFGLARREDTGATPDQGLRWRKQRL